MELTLKYKKKNEEKYSLKKRETTMVSTGRWNLQLFYKIGKFDKKK